MFNNSRIPNQMHFLNLPSALLHSFPGKEKRKIETISSSSKNLPSSPPEALWRRSVNPLLSYPTAPHSSLYFPPFRNRQRENAFFLGKVHMEFSSPPPYTGSPPGAVEARDDSTLKASHSGSYSFGGQPTVQGG